jgi:signal transduction histidine kinase
MITTRNALITRLGRVSPVRRDLALAVALLVLLLLDSWLSPEGGGVTVLGVFAGVIATLPLAVRSRAPILVAVVLTMASIPVLATLRPLDAVALPTFFALYNVAATGARGRSLLIAAAMTGAVIAIVALFSPSGDIAANAAQNVGLLLAALALGDAVRWRAAYRASQREHVARQISEERLRIARDLHDSIAHAMTAINVQAGAAAHLLQRRPEAAAAALAEIRRVSGEALGDLRGTLGQLRDGGHAPLRPAPSLDGLDDLVERVRAAGVDVSLTRYGTSGRIPASLEAAAHRIVQEALTNVLRHSRASVATVTVTVDDTSLVLDVSDDGNGTLVSVDHESDQAGFGLLGMRERALSVGGHVEACPRPGGGWCVHANLPLAVE